jgi:RimJ/RimL family protein N-acetyltransferase
LLVRLGQEVQEVPRRVAPPDPPLHDDEIRLEPLTQAHVPELLVMAEDPDVVRFTRVPAGADETFVRGWIGRYEEGWAGGSRAAFAIRGHDEGFLGFAGFVDLDLEHREGEIGYMVAPAARGRGIAPRAVELLTGWGFDELDLIRLELRIDIQNPRSARVAERAGYQRDGVLRNVHFKEGLRCDLAVWSRLREDDPFGHRLVTS